MITILLEKIKALLIELKSNIQNISSDVNYYETETKGGLWIDGSQIYRKVIKIDNPELGGTDYKSFNHNITHLDRIISATASAKNSTYFYAPSTLQNQTESNYFWLSWINSTQFQLRTKSITGIEKVCVILEYTKTEV